MPNDNTLFIEGLDDVNEPKKPTIPTPDAVKKMKEKLGLVQQTENDDLQTINSEISSLSGKVKEYEALDSQKNNSQSKTYGMYSGGMSVLDAVKPVKEVNDKYAELGKNISGDRERLAELNRKRDEIIKAQVSPLKDAIKQKRAELEQEYAEVIPIGQNIERQMRSGGLTFDDYYNIKEFDRGFLNLNTKTKEQSDLENRARTPYKEFIAKKKALDISEQYLNKLEKEADISPDNYLKALGQGFANHDWIDLATLGAKSMAENFNLAEISKRVKNGTASEEEKTALTLYDQFNQLASTKDKPITYDIAQSFIQSLPYMADIAISGGVRSAITKGVTKGIGRMVIGLSDNIAGAIANKTAQKVATGAIKNTAKIATQAAGAIASSPLQVNMYSNIARNELDNYIIGYDDNGEINVREAKDFKNGFQNTMRALMTTASATFSESSGKVFDDSFAMLGKKFGLGKINNRYINDLSKKFAEIKKATNVQGTLGETFEEYVNKFTDNIVTDPREEEGRDEWANFFDTREGLTIIGSTILTQAMFGVGNLPNRYDRMKLKADVQQFESILPKDIKDGLIKAMSAETANEQVDALASLNLGEIKDPAIRRNVVDYISSKIKYDFAKGVAQGDQELYRIRKVDESVNSIIHDTDGVLYVASVTDNNRPDNEVYILSGNVNGDKNEPVVILDEDGSKVMTTMANVRVRNQMDAGTLREQLILSELTKQQQEQAEEEGLEKAESLGINTQEIPVVGEEVALPDGSAIKIVAVDNNGVTFDMLDPEGMTMDTKTLSFEEYSAMQNPQQQPTAETARVETSQPEQVAQPVVKTLTDGKTALNITLNENNEGISNEVYDNLPDAEKVVKTLSKRFSKLEFQVIDQSDDDPFTPDAFVISVKPKTQTVNEGKVEGAITAEESIAPETVANQVSQQAEEGQEQEVNNQSDASHGTIAADYLFTGGVDVIGSSDYLLQALIGAFPKAGALLNDIRNKYSNEINTNHGDIKEFINSDLYKQIMSEIKNAINTTYNNSEVDGILDQILQYPTGLPVKLGNQLSTRLDEINNSNNEQDIQGQQVQPEIENQEQVAGEEVRQEEGQEPIRVDESNNNVANTPVVETQSNDRQIEQLVNDIEGRVADVQKMAEIKAEERNVNPEPTDAQKEAGNYAKGHIKVRGLDITIENAKGSTRKGKDAKGNAWRVKMNNTYGYFKRTQGKDGDQIDVFLGENPESGKIFVVDQIRKTGDSKLFDEHKVMMGFKSSKEAKEAYLSNYSKGWDGFGAITEMSEEQFKEWLGDGTRTKQPVAWSDKKKSNPNAFLPKRAIELMSSDPQSLDEAIIQHILRGGKFSRNDYIRHSGFKEGSDEVNKAAFNGLINGKDQQEGTQFDTFLGLLGNDFGKDDGIDLINSIVDVINLSTRANLARKLIEVADASQDNSLHTDNDYAQALAEQEEALRLAEDELMNEVAVLFYSKYPQITEQEYAELFNFGENDYNEQGNEPATDGDLRGVQGEIHEDGRVDNAENRQDEDGGIAGVEVDGRGEGEGREEVNPQDQVPEVGNMVESQEANRVPDVKETIEKPEYGSEQYNNPDSWAEYVNSVSDRNVISFADFKRALKSKYTDDSHNEVSYSLGDKPIGVFQTDINSVGLRGWYNDWVEGKETYPEQTEKKTISISQVDAIKTVISLMDEQEDTLNKLKTIASKPQKTAKDNQDKTQLEYKLGLIEDKLNKAQALVNIPSDKLPAVTKLVRQALADEKAIDARIESLNSQRKNKEKEFNSRNGVFGDNKEIADKAKGQQALFAGDIFEASTNTLANTIKPITDSIAKLEEEKQRNAKILADKVELELQGAQQEIKEEVKEEQPTPEVKPEFAGSVLEAESKTENKTYSIPETFNLSTFSKFDAELNDGNVQVDDFKKAFNILRESKTSIIDELNKKTKAELLANMNSMGQYRYKNENKDSIVKALYSDMLMTFSFGTISYGMGETMEQAIAKKVEVTTQEQINDHVDEVKKRREEYLERVKAHKKAISNPETLDEFKVFIKYNGIEKLSPEQKATYDDLVTDKVLENRSDDAKKGAIVEKVDLGDVEMSIAETKHTKTGVPLFVVRLSARIPEEQYKELNKKAKQLGGYYSSYAKDGAIPGFQFKTLEQAQSFSGLKTQDASNIELKEEAKEQKVEQKISKLRENAQKIIERVDAELNRDRLTNTAKRAREAASVEARLNEEKRIAQTMLNIADAIENGDVKLLDGIKAKTHIELLDNLIKSAKYAEISSKAESYSDRMKYEGDPATLETIEYLKHGFYPSIYGTTLKDVINKVENKPGLKQLATKWSKKLSGLGEYDSYQVTNDADISEIEQLFNGLSESDKKYNRIGTVLADFNRLKTMGIENDSMLRAALREYIQFRGKKQAPDKVKELERAIVGRAKNLGVDFFPTPAETAKMMVELAGVTEDMEVLEPSAGNGNIADQIKQVGVMPDVIEISSELSEILKAKGYNVVADDFMQYTEKKYDRIIMNPPFSNGMDGDHVQHAYELLKPGGKLVAIVGEGTFIRNDKKATAFREWLDEVGGTETKLESGTFQDKTLLNTTGANARVVVIEKEEKEDGNVVMFRANNPTFYANSEKALESLSDNNRTPEQWKAELLKNGAKESELNYMGWNQFVEGKRTLTKNDLTEFVNSNKVEVQEIVKGEMKPFATEENITKVKFSQEGSGSYLVHYKIGEDEGLVEIGSFEAEDETEAKKLAIERINNSFSDYVRQDTKYSGYTTPGGKNYREVLLTLPVQQVQGKYKAIQEGDLWLLQNETTGNKIQQYYSNKSEAEEAANDLSKPYNDIKSTFTSSHFGEPNIAAHVRLSEFTDKQGRRVLLVDEVQSDWAQKGKKEGFKGTAEFNEEEFNTWYNKNRSGDDQTLEEFKQSDEYTQNRIKQIFLEEKQERIDRDAVPDMPFKKTDQWVGLGMKWAIQYAAKNGFDGVAWTTGEQQAQRYDLSKQVDSIATKKERNGLYTILGDKNGKDVFTQSDIPENQLEGIIGKDLAKKIIDYHNEVSSGWNSFSGIDLQIGGEGMIAFYDQIIPSWVNKYAKKFGTKTTTTEIDTTPDIVEHGIDLNTGEVGKDKNYQQVHYLPISDSMVRGVVQGQPLFRSASEMLNGSESQRKFLAIQSEFNRIAELSNGAITAELVRTVDELPEALRRNGVSEKSINEISEAVKESRVSGFFINGKAYVISDNSIDEKEAVRTLIHERGLHGGIRILIPDAETRLDFLEKVFESVGEDAFNKMVIENGGHPDQYKKQSNWQKGEEYLAFLSEKIITEKDLTPKERGVWEWLKNYINNLIAKVLRFDVNSIKFTDKELAHIVRASVNANYVTTNATSGRGRTQAETSSQENREGDRDNSVLEGSDRGDDVHDNVQYADSRRSRCVQHIKDALRKEELNNLPYNHGTFAEFKQFDFNKVGEGTGEKIHGHGLYFNITTKDKEVGKSYARMGTLYTPKGMAYMNEIGEKLGKLSQSYLNKAFLKNHGNEEKETVLNTLKGWLSTATQEKNREALSSLVDFVENKQFPNDRYLMTGTIKTRNKEFNFLHWDDPLFKDQWDAIIDRLKVEQFNENELIEKVAEKTYSYDMDGGYNYSDPTGASVYRSLSEILGGDVVASNFLRRAGIDGTMFFDKAVNDGDSRVNVCLFSDEGVEVNDTVMFRTAGEYVEGASNATKLSKTEKAQEFVQDRMYSVRKLLDVVQKRGGVVEDFSNIYVIENLAASKADAAMDAYRDNELKNVTVAVANVMNATGKSYNEITDYLIAKHTPERNEYFRSQGRTGERFAGEWTDEEAKAITDAFEQEVGDELVNSLWRSINEATDYTLHRTYQYGFINKDEYKALKERWKFYVPLRGWKVKDEIDSIWDYANKDSERTFDGMAKAKGRTSKSDDPIAHIASMAHSMVVSGEKNMIKQSAFRLANANKDMDDLFTVKKIYQVITGKDADGNDIVTDTYEKPEQKLYDEGKVITKTNRNHNRYRSGGEAKQHEVSLWINGEKAVVIFDDPNVASAINYENMFQDKATLALQNTVGRFTRFLSTVFTSKNPAFIPINLLRDLGYSSMSHLIRDDGNFTGYAKNLAKAKKAISRKLKGKADPKNDSLDHLYEQFLKYGGETGWVHLDSIDRIKGKLQKDIRKLDKTSGFARKVLVDGIVNNAGELLDRMATVSENISRFATFLASVEQGKSYQKAAYDAKNITVNFNRKGRATGLFGSIYAFFNASIQGGNNVISMAVNNKGKFAFTAAMFYGAAILNAALHDATEDDDDETYFDNSDYVRQNNLVINIGNGEYLSLPLPHGFRSFYALGDMTYMLMKGMITEGDLVKNGLSAVISNVSPVDPVGVINKKGELDPRPIIPTFAVPFYDIATNSDFSNRRIYREAYTPKDEMFGAESQRYDKNVSPVFRAITDGLFKLGGGDPSTGLKESWDKKGNKHTVSSFADWNPSKAEYFFTYYTGGTGKFFNDLVKFSGNVITESKEAMKNNDELSKTLLDVYTGVDFNNAPVINRLIREPRSYEFNKEYYAIMRDLNSMDFAISRYNKVGDRDIARKLKRSEVYRVADRAKEKIDRIMDRITRGNLTAEKFEEYDKEITAIKKETVEKIRKLKGNDTESGRD